MKNRNSHLSFSLPLRLWVACVFCLVFADDISGQRQPTNMTVPCQPSTCNYFSYDGFERVVSNGGYDPSGPMHYIPLDQYCLIPVDVNGATDQTGPTLFFRQSNAGYYKIPATRFHGSPDTWNVHQGYSCMPADSNYKFIGLKGVYSLQPPSLPQPNGHYDYHNDAIGMYVDNGQLGGFQVRVKARAVSETNSFNYVVWPDVTAYLDLLIQHPGSLISGGNCNYSPTAGFFPCYNNGLNPPELMRTFEVPNDSKWHWLCMDTILSNVNLFYLANRSWGNHPQPIDSSGKSYVLVDDFEVVPIPPDNDFSFNPPPNVCWSDTLMLSDYVKPGASVCFSGDGVTNSQFIANNAGSGIHTITAHFYTPLGCDYWIQKNIEVLGKPSYPSSQLFCPGDSINITFTSQTPQCTYTWSGPNMSGTGNIVIPNATTLDAGLYGCTVTDPSGTLNCSMPATVNIQLDTNCCNIPNPNYLLINDTISLSSLPPASSIPANTVIAVMGNVHIDIPCQFSGVEFVFYPNASIQVDANAALILDKCHLHSGCNKLWQGIHVTTGSFCSAERCLIEDAVTGIAADDGTIIRAHSSTFNKNYIGLYSTGAAIDFDLDALNFYSLSNGYDINSAPADLLQQGNATIPIGLPAALARPYAGIFMVSVANPFYMANFDFRHLSKGAVFLACADVNSKYCHFSDIHNYGYTTTPLTGYEGVGLYANQVYNFSEYGFGSDKTNPYSFERCDEGIQVVGSPGSAEGNHMTETGLGFECDYLPDTLSFSFANNNLELCRLYGVYLFMNGHRCNIDIVQNQIQASSATTAYKVMGIVANEYSKNYIRIERNNIDIDRGLYGIFMNNVHNSFLSENSVRLENNPLPKPRMGIFATSCSNTEIKCNKVLSAVPFNTAGNNTTAIELFNSIQTVVSDDSISETTDGIGVYGLCYNSDIRGNKIYNHSIGLHYSNTAVTSDPNASFPPHVGRNNQWLGVYGSSYGAVHDASQYLQVQLSLYKTKNSHTVNPVELPSFYTPSGIPWFSPDPTIPCLWPNCAGDNAACDQQQNAHRGITGLELAIAQGNIPIDQYQTPLNWEADKALYEKLYQDNSLLVPGTSVDSFYVIKSTEPLGGAVTS